MPTVAYLGATTGKDAREIERRERIANELVNANVTYLSVESGPLSVESGVEEVWAAAELLPLVDRHRDDFDAFVVGCFAEPGVRPLRELTEKPVLATAELWARHGVSHSPLAYPPAPREKFDGLRG